MTKRFTLLLLVMGLVALAGVGHAVAADDPPANQPATAERAAACTEPIPPDADPVVIKTVYEVGWARRVSDKVMLAAFEAGWVESRMHALDCGDRDSVGVFQQRPSQGWCETRELCIDVVHASNRFFDAALSEEAACPSCPAGEIAARVQRPADEFRDRYQQAESTARALMVQAERMLHAPPQPAPPPEARRGVSSGFAVAWTPDRLDVFGRSDGVPHHNYFDRAAGAGFPGWHSLPGATDMRSRPTVVSQHNGRLDVFAVGSDQKIQQWYFDRLGANRWLGPGTLGNTTFAGPPTAVSWEPGRIDLFARDTRNNLRHSYFQHNVTDGFTDWETLGSDLAGDPVAVGWSAGRWDVFAVTAGGRMQHWYFDRLGDARWLGPQELPGATFQGKPAAVSWTYGRLDVFGRDTNNRLLHSYFQRGATTAFSSWGALGDGGLASNPVAITRYNGRLDVFYVHGSDNLMRQMYFDRIGANRWLGPGRIGSTTFTSTIDAVSWLPARIDLFGVDTNSRMRHAYFQHGDTTGFSSWGNLGHTFQ